MGVETMFCDGDCTYVQCGDGYHNMLSEACDDGNELSDDGCVGACQLAFCGDEFIYAGMEDCDDGDMQDNNDCKNDCTISVCGDGIVWDDGDGEEECDDANMSNDDACTTNCTMSFCGDGILWQGMETCDDGNEIDSDACPGSCEPAVCGDGFVQMGLEECDDGNDDDSDSCNNACEYGPFACANGSVQLSISPGGNMIICDDPNNQTCEQDFETLCPPGWGLCSQQQFVNRNAGWNYAVNGQNIVVGEIYCRGGGGAGHYTLGPGANVLSNDIPFNCNYGSSRPNVCPAVYGCNELFLQALCCAPTGSCGNGMVEGPEETCDDGNQIETDACLNSCTLRQPQGC